MYYFSLSHASQGFFSTMLVVTFLTLFQSVASYLANDPGPHIVFVFRWMTSWYSSRVTAKEGFRNSADHQSIPFRVQLGTSQKYRKKGNLFFIYALEKEEKEEEGNSLTSMPQDRDEFL